MKQKIFEFEPIMKRTLWGGDAIGRFRGDANPQTGVGESWEISAVPGSESVVSGGDDRGMTLGELCRKYGSSLLGKRSVSRYGDTFPLLVKIIDAARDLSVQVHPDDALAEKRHGCRGKTEMWYVVKTDNGARIRCGLKKSIPEGGLSGIVAEGNLDSYIDIYDSVPGDCYFIPAGRIHGIGAGNLLVEIQESSDITYRIDDFGRLDANGNPRELHLDLAEDAIERTPSADSRVDYERKSEGVVTMVDCDYFKTSVITLQPGGKLDLEESDSFRIFVCVEGEAYLCADNGEKILLRCGHSALAAASCSRLELIPEGGTPARIIMSEA